MSLDDEIAHLRDLDLHGLRARWKSIFRRQPLPHLPRHLLFAVLVQRLQADELGDLEPATARLLKQIATGTREASCLTEEYSRTRTDLRPGTILMREWNARAHRVMVVDKGFAWNGKTKKDHSRCGRGQNRPSHFPPLPGPRQPQPSSRRPEANRRQDQAPPPIEWTHHRRHLLHPGRSPLFCATASILVRSDTKVGSSRESNLPSLIEHCSMRFKLN